MAGKGKNRTKCQKYQSEGRRERNKARNVERDNSRGPRKRGPTAEHDLQLKRIVRAQRRGELVI